MKKIKIVKKALRVPVDVVVNYNYGCSSTCCRELQHVDHCMVIHTVATITGAEQVRCENLPEGEFLVLREEYGYTVEYTRGQFRAKGIQAHNWKKHKEEYTR